MCYEIPSNPVSEDGKKKYKKSKLLPLKLETGETVFKIAHTSAPDREFRLKNWVSLTIKPATGRSRREVCIFDVGYLIQLMYTRQEIYNDAQIFMGVIYFLSLSIFFESFDTYPTH